ncbi:MAG: helix-turn-helix domain-containing protein [Clostridia bacterium]|nr:helix-turn-helix domain-containing protein [Clostridia bacterium]
MDIKELRTMSKMTQKAFAEYFGIPKRTIEQWEGNQRECKEYIIELMKYKLEKENLI